MHRERYELAAFHSLCQFPPVCSENSDSDVLVMQSAEECMRHDTSDPLNWAHDGRIFVQRAVRSDFVVIARNLTPARRSCRRRCTLRLGAFSFLRPV
jgi:hypothetical protein